MSEHEVANHKEEQQAEMLGPGLGTNRVEALADGIFAVAMTLLVLDVRPPTDPHQSISTWFSSEWPRLFAYALSFAILGVYWVSHHAHFQYIRRTNRLLLWINILFFLFISLIPFSASWLADAFDPAYHGQQEVILIVYGLHLIVMAALIALHWWYGSSNHLLTGGKTIDTHFSLSVYRRVAISPIICLIAIALSFVFPIGSIICYALIPIIYIFPSHIDLHWTRGHPNGEHNHVK
jgi:uncharacterized membrane protein